VRSLRSRLLVLWLLSLLACAAVGVLLVQLYGQSTTAQTGRAEAEVARACDLIRDRYGFYVTGWRGPVPPLSDAGLRRDLGAVVTLALARQDGVEGGLWQAEAGPLAYAYPTYEGGGRPKMDLPAAELDRIRTVNAQAAGEEQAAARRWDGAAESLLIQACPVIAGPIPDLTAWAMMRVRAAPGTQSLRLGLGVLLALVLASSGWLTRLVLVWSRHVAGIERALAAGDGAFPVLAPTGERELDRIVAALNDAGQRLAEARRRSESLAARVTAAERLAGLGRVAAGVAHEIRNPLAAMRLRAENALAAGDDARRRSALAGVLDGVARLDALVSELLAMTQRREARPVPTVLGPFLATLADRYSDEAARRGVALDVRCPVEQATLDPEIVGRILDNLVQNALRHAPEGGQVAIAAAEAGERLRVTVADTGPGIAPNLRRSLFEPFVTGRADGTGLGLAIARELAEGHGGRLLLLRAGGEAPGEGAVFALDLPREPRPMNGDATAYPDR
jgi:signal transduction histidine kinase